MVDVANNVVGANGDSLDCVAAGLEAASLAVWEGIFMDGDEEAGWWLIYNFATHDARPWALADGLRPPVRAAHMTYEFQSLGPQVLSMRARLPLSASPDLSVPPDRVHGSAIGSRAPIVPRVVPTFA